MKPDQATARALESLRTVPPPDREKRTQAQAAFLAQSRELRTRPTLSAVTQIREWMRQAAQVRIPFPRRLKLAAPSALLVAAVLFATTGVVRAADDAVPGDVLYVVDRAAEEIRLRLTTNQEQAVALRLQLADERLDEVGRLWQRGDTDSVEAAMTTYGKTIAAVAQTVARAEDATQERLSLQMSEAMESHERQLDSVLLGSEDEGDGPPSAEDEEDLANSPWCADGSERQHPAAAKLAAQYDATYEAVIDWFCDGYGVGDIMLALQTSEETGVPAAELLAMRADIGWGLVWQGLTLIGKPGDARPEGEEGGPEDPAVSPWCADDDHHPALDKLAQEHEVEYDDVIGWFCAGYGVGDIKLALETSEETGGKYAFGDLLEMKTELGGWGLVWQDLGLIGKKEGEAPSDDDDDSATSPWCDGDDVRHPALEKLAREHGLDYEAVIGYFCHGYSIGDIKLALETSEEAGETPGDLLSRKNELGGWGLVWQELGLIGKPGDAGPPAGKGKPDNPGSPPDKGKPDDVGKPE